VVQEIGCDDALVAAENEVRVGGEQEVLVHPLVSRSILFTAPHNVHEARYPRVDNWNDVRRRFLA
jgi:hypothetical protein